MKKVNGKRSKKPILIYQQLNNSRVLCASLDSYFLFFRFAQIFFAFQNHKSARYFCVGFEPNGIDDYYFRQHFNFKYLFYFIGSIFSISVALSNVCVCLALFVFLACLVILSHHIHSMLPI